MTVPTDPASLRKSANAHTSVLVEAEHLRSTAFALERICYGRDHHQGGCASFAAQSPGAPGHRWIYWCLPCRAAAQLLALADRQERITELLDALGPVLDNAEGYDKLPPYHPDERELRFQAWTRGQLLAFEARARAAYKVALADEKERQPGGEKAT